MNPSRYFIFILLVLFTALGPLAKAQEVDETRRQSISFEDELVEGGAEKPELFYLLQKRNFNYKKLIKLRNNFIPEMNKTSEMVQPGSSR